jgi:hypothetical protein
LSLLTPTATVLWQKRKEREAKLQSEPAHAGCAGRHFFTFSLPFLYQKTSFGMVKVLADGHPKATSQRDVATPASPGPVHGIRLTVSH